jgi:hypothetical protein
VDLDLLKWRLTTKAKQQFLNSTELISVADKSLLAKLAHLKTVLLAVVAAAAVLLEAVAAAAAVVAVVDSVAAVAVADSVAAVAVADSVAETDKPKNLH